MAADEEIKFRVPSATKQLIREAAELEQVTLTQFVLSAAATRARASIEQAEATRYTRWPKAFFDAMQSSLETPDELNPKMLEAFRKLANVDVESLLS